MAATPEISSLGFWGGSKRAREGLCPELVPEATQWNPGMFPLKTAERVRWFCTELREVFPCLSIELMTRSLTYSADAVLS